ncbi:hypothetical protein BH10CYA1_BH10CYA1_61220 [soil metagenome]
MSSHERAEAQITRTAHHSNDSSNAFHQEYMDSTRNGQISAAKQDSGASKHENNYGLPNLILDGTTALKQELNREGKQIWDGLDSNPTTHFIKHDYCHDEPIKVGIAVAGLATVGAIAAVAAAPEIAAAGLLYSIGTVAAAAAGVANIVLADDYLTRHR